MTMILGTRLAPIPVVDVRDGGPFRHATESRARARALRDACIRWLPGVAAGLLPAIDSVTRRWLLQSRSSYAEEVKAIAAELDFSGVWFLNGCYQWGCTALAREQSGVSWIAPYSRRARHLGTRSIGWRRRLSRVPPSTHWLAVIQVSGASSSERKMTSSAVPMTLAPQTIGYSRCPVGSRVWLPKRFSHAQEKRQPRTAARDETSLRSGPEFSGWNLIG
jgi:hypothetical protein